MHDRDPLATYDRLGRKEPKRLGFQEFVRSHPWVMGAFKSEVPGDFYIQDGEEVVVACPCGVDPPPRIAHNTATQCTGNECGRWFFWIGSRVLVARFPTTTSAQG